MKNSLKIMKMVSVSLMVLFAMSLTACGGGGGGGGDSVEKPESPIVMALPPVTTESEITVMGKAETADVVVLQTGAGEWSATPSEERKAFAIPAPLDIGANELRIYAQKDGRDSDPVVVNIERLASPNLTLTGIDPTSSSSGAIVTLTGTGFAADRKTMHAFFQGPQRSSVAVTLEATATSLQVAVPFTFFRTDDVVQVYVYSDSGSVSNSIDLQVTPSQDPTPATYGNELSNPFDHLLTQTQLTLSKAEQLLQPYVTPGQWAPIAEDFQRIETFLEGARDELLTTESQEALSSLDAMFGSEVMEYVNDRMEQINDLLNHSTYSEAACVVSDVVYILNETIDVLDLITDILLGAEIACVFIPPCWPFLVALEVAREVLEAVIDVLCTIKNVLMTAVPSEPTNWRIDVTGPYPGISNDTLYTETESILTLWADFTNGGSTRIVSEVSSIGSWVLDLLDIELPEVKVEDVKVASTVVISGENPPGLSVGQDVAADDHTMVTYTGQGVVNLDVRGSCGPYQYPSQTGGDPYPEFHAVEVIDKPRVNSVWWDDLMSVWQLEGKGFSDQCGIGFQVFWNGELVDCETVRQLGHNSFYVRGNQFKEAGRLTFGVVDGDLRLAEPVLLATALREDLNIFNPFPSVVQVGDLVTVAGEGLSPYVYDTTLRFYVGSELIVEGQPLEITTQEPWVGDDSFTFQVPPELTGHEDETVRVELEVAVSDMVTGGGGMSDSVLIDVRFAESAEAGDQDLVVFEDDYSYLRTAHIADLDRDGENDLIVGVPEYRTTLGPDEVVIGAVYIAFGPVSGNLLASGQQYIDLAKVGLTGGLKEHWDVMIRGSIFDYDEASGHSRRIGNAIASGDINGDGIVDLVLGSTDQDEDDAHKYNNTLSALGVAHIPGKAFVFYGRSRAQWLEYNGLWIANSSFYDIRIHGDNQRELGYQVAVGDLNNDGFADIAVGAPTDSLNPTLANDLVARTYVVFGSATLPAEINVDTGADIVITGQDVYQSLSANKYWGDGLGKGLASGDINGDGIDDLLVGAPDYHISHGSAPDYQYGIGDMYRQGVIYVFYGGTTLKSSYEVGPFGDQDVLILGPSTHLYYTDEPTPIGRAIAIADLNGDGANEIVVGLPDVGNVYVGRGTNIPASGIISAEYIDVVFSQRTRSWRLGASVAAGDVNGDGYLDVVMGAPTESGSLLGLVPGRVWIVLGEASPDWLSGGKEYLFLDDYIDAAPGAIIQPMLIMGEHARPDFGLFVTAGDLAPYEGDDVLIVDPTVDAREPPPETGTRQSPGMLYIFYEGSNVLRTHTEPESLDLGHTVTGVLDGFGDEDAWEWDCTGETVSVDVTVTSTDAAEAVSAYLYDRHHMILAQGLHIMYAATPETGAYGLLVRSGIDATVGYDLEVLCGEGEATLLTVVTELPYVPTDSYDALIDVDIDTDSIIVGDWASLGERYTLWVYPFSADEARFELEPYIGAWEPYSHSHDNPVPENVWPDFIIRNTGNNNYYKLKFGFTVQGDPQTMSINSIVGWNCGTSPTNCPDIIAY